MYGSLQYDRQGDPLEPPGWRQELPRRWANSRTEKESKKNTTAEARAGEVQNRWFAAGEERLVTRRGLQDTAPERCAKVEWWSQERPLLHSELRPCPRVPSPQHVPNASLT